jgi:hypothetical protein
MSKQTAVEWLEQEFIKLESTIGVYGIMYKLIDQAKAMEKEQIESAWMATDNELQRLAAEKYYNETYGGSNHIADTSKMVCEHQYSRSMNQPYPRKCIKCKEVEGGEDA